MHHEYSSDQIRSDREKDILLAIGQELAYIREKKELLPLLKEQLKRLSFQNDITIAKIGENQKTFSAFLVDSHSDRSTHPDFEKMSSARHRFPDGVFEVVEGAAKLLGLPSSTLNSRIKKAGYSKGAFLYFQEI